MRTCPKCTAEVVPGAKFCHRCGDRLIIRQKACPKCTQMNPLASVFCHQCGFHFDRKTKEGAGYVPVFVLDFGADDLTEQVKALFFKNLRENVETEYDVRKYSEFVERFYQSRFREIFSVRSEQIAVAVHALWSRKKEQALPSVDRYMEEAFEGLLDYFIVQFCPDLTGMVLPSTVLKYEQVSLQRVDLRQLISDYLDFGKEQEAFYFDFIAMDAQLLQNACKHFLFAGKDERIYFICDLSLKRNCKDGFAMTSEGMYWKAPLDKAHKLDYRHIDAITFKKDHLLLNGAFFTANPRLNLKIYKLLKKIKRRWGAPHETEAV